MLPQPRQQKPSRAKRLSAPAKTLTKDTQLAVASTINESEVYNTPETTNDLLDFLNFGDSKANDTLAPVSNPFLTTNKSAPSNLGSISENTITNNNDMFDPFNDLFEPDTKTAGANNDHKRHSQPPQQFSQLKIHPRLANPRESASLKPDNLFDVSMWEEFNEPSTAGNPRTTKASSTIIDRNQTIKPKKRKKTKKKKTNDNTPEMKQNTSKKESVEQVETNCLQELQRGSALLKYPRRTGFPHFKHIQLSTDNQRIQWFSKRKPLNQTCIWIKDIREVVKGQETEVFKKFHQKTLEKSSFSIVYGNKYSTLDVAAKSIDECEMWVKTIRKLVEIHKDVNGNLSSLKVIHCGIYFKDRNRPMSRAGSGAFIRANNSKTLKIDPVALKEIEKDMEMLHKNYQKLAQMTQKTVILNSSEYPNVQYVLSELEERIEELTYEVANIRDTELAKREVWRANVDLTAIQEKVEVLVKYSGANRRRSNFL